MQRQGLMPSVGVIAARFGVQIHQVEYLIRARNIQPIAWVGHARVFSDQDVARIGRELSDIRAKNYADGAERDLDASAGVKS